MGGRGSSLKLHLSDGYPSVAWQRHWTEVLRDQVSLRGFVCEIAVAAQLNADSRKVQLMMDSVHPALVISVDGMARTRVG